MAGLSGLMGLMGLAGFMGLMRLAGLTGLMGLMGLAGLVGLMGLTGLTGLAGLTGLMGLVGLAGLMGLVRRESRWASLNRVLGAFFIMVGAVIRVFGRFGGSISCVAGSTLIRSCAKNGIPNTASEFARGATRSSAGSLEVQFFEGMLILALIFSLTSTPVGWNA